MPGRIASRFSAYAESCFAPTPFAPRVLASERSISSSELSSRAVRRVSARKTKSSPPSRDRIEIFGDSLAHRLTAQYLAFRFVRHAKVRRKPEPCKIRLYRRKTEAVYGAYLHRGYRRDKLSCAGIEGRSAQARARRRKSLSLISALAAFVKVTASTSEGFTSESGEVRSRMSRAVRTAVFPEPAAADRRRSLPRCSIASS